MFIWDQVGTPNSFLPFNLIIIMIFISFQRICFKLGWRRMKAFKLRYYFANRKVPGRLLHLYSLKLLKYIEAFRYVFKAPIRKTCELSRQISSNSFVLNVLLRKKVAYTRPRLTCSQYSLVDWFRCSSTISADPVFTILTMEEFETPSATWRFNNVKSWAE